MLNRKVCWLSAGVSSSIAGYLAKDVTDYIYIDMRTQHPDSMRFIRDCEELFGKEVEILRSQKYKDIYEVFKARGVINTAQGAPCTGMLKKQVRFQWEAKAFAEMHKGDKLTYVWGLDKSEVNRAERLRASMCEVEHEFPLIEANLSKAEAHGLLERLGIKRPKMYDMGYENNNCIGCVKGGMAYWNKIRKDFPETFDRMAKLERELDRDHPNTTFGHTCLKGIYLDELPEDAGRKAPTIIPDCTIMCELSIMEKERQMNEEKV